MGLFSRTKDNSKRSGAKADKSSAKSELVGEYKLVEIWDYEAAQKVYALYCYQLYDVSIYGLNYCWEELGRGNKAWAERTTKGISITQGNDLVKGDSDDK